MDCPQSILGGHLFVPMHSRLRKVYAQRQNRQRQGILLISKLKFSKICLLASIRKRSISRGDNLQSKPVQTTSGAKSPRSQRNIGRFAKS
jgi:hypothetical protein